MAPAATETAEAATGHTGRIPGHVAIIMDGNGRWAQKRSRPRNAGHRAGVRAAREIVEACGRAGIGTLTLFAFSSENWRRPPSEVSLLMRLFVEALQREIAALHENKVRVRFIGAREMLNPALQENIARAEELTRDNTGLNLAIAVAYGGRWDLVRAARLLAEQAVRGELAPHEIDEARLAGELALADLPDPDLFIRTGGEQRISNFLLWNLAYTELYFTDALWPDFDAAELNKALAMFAGRQRRFGLIGEQVGEQAGGKAG